MAAGSTQTPVTNGVFSIALDTGLVNDANPNGYAYYQVSYNLTPTGCNPAPEQWLLYFSGTPLNLANVRTLNLPIGFTLVPLAWLAQDGATNTQCIVWSGNTWAPGSCGGGGGGGNYYNTISVTQPPYNADPTGATDSTAAIAAACAAAKTLGGASTFGSTLFFPPGRYKTDTITCLSSGGTGMTFQGAGGQSSWLVSLSGNDLIAISTTGTVHGITIKDLGIDGAAGASNRGIYIVGTVSGQDFNFQLENLTIQNVGGQCILDTNSFNMKVRRVSCKSLSNNGIEISGDNSSSITDSYVHQVGAGKAGYVVYSGATTLIGNSGLDGSASNTIWGQFGQSLADGDSSNTFAFITMIGNDIEDFSQYGVRVKNGTLNLHGNSFLAYPTTTTQAIHYDNNGTGLEMNVIDSGTTFTTGGAWANGQAIHAASTCPGIYSMSWNGSAATSYNCYNETLMAVYNIPVFSLAQPAFHTTALSISSLASPNAWLTLTNSTGLPLSTGVVGNLPIGNNCPASGASSSTFLRGDCTWSTPIPGGGTSGWSAVPLTFASNATQYAPIVGGVTTSTTETDVSLAFPAAATISHLTVTISAQLGASATLAVTLDDGTGTPTALTCITASGGTACTDFTHTVNALQGDVLSFKLVSGGSVSAGTPKITIGYLVGTTSSTNTQGGVAALTTPVTVNTANTETQILSYIIPANTVSAGTTYRIKAYATCATTHADVTRHFMRLGTTGTLSDTALYTFAVLSAPTATVGYTLEFLVTFNSTTISNSSVQMLNGGTITGIQNQGINNSSPVQVTGLNTTVSNVLQLSFLTTAATTAMTFNNATIEVVKP